jgi:hypothetical protein
MMLDDGIVLFQMPGAQEAHDLLERLQADRPVWLRNRDGASLVAASIRPKRGDLALLLRAVEAWVGECGHAAIQFELDERAYVLWSPAATLAQTAA